MEKNRVIELLTPIVRDIFEDPELLLTDELNSSEVDSWTSLSFMLLLDRIEKEFGFKFKIFELINIKNMGDLISAVSSHLQ